MATSHAAPHVDPRPGREGDLAGGPPPVVRRAPARERWSWALYDFANTIWSMNVASLYFAVWLISDLGASNTSYAVANGVSSALVALSIPVLGAISDARGRRMPWIVGFTLLACLATVAMAVVGQSMLPLYGDAVIGGAARPEGYHAGGAALAWLVVAFIVANYAYQAAQPFYNAMLPELVPPRELGTLSGIGTAVGYCGTIVGLLLVAPFFNGALPIPGTGPLPEGLLGALRGVVPFTSHAGRVSTLAPTAFAFLLFSLPLFTFCRDRYPRREPVQWRRAFADVKRTLVDTRRYPGARRFVVASLMYQDAIGTIVSFMAVYAVRAMHFERGAETKLFLVLTLPAIVGSYVCGRLVDRVGPKRTLMGVIAGWVLLLLGMIAAPSSTAFWIVGAAIGFIFGGVPTAERPMLLSLIPEREAGRFFGLLMLSARAAAIVGPFIWGLTVDGLEPSFGSGVAYRAAVGAVALAMVLALVILAGVPDTVRGAARGGARDPGGATPEGAR
ncbi:MAG: MFS transporter [Gemmatimonadaceae bacterium]